jgi:lipopolysaccharide heptosyltransferase II
MIHTDWKGVRNLLAVRLDSMGDMLMTTPALRALKESLKGVHITLLASNVGAEIASHIPEIDEVIPFQAPWVATGTQPRPEEVRRALEAVRQQAFEAAVIFTVNSQNPLPAALFLYQADIPLRLGYAKENPYDLLSHWVPDPEPAKLVRHEVERQLALVKTIGATTRKTALSFQVTWKDLMMVRHLMVSLGLGREPWFILHPGSREARRSYPAEQFIEAAEMVLSMWPGKVLVTGIAEETDLVRQIVKRLGQRAIPLAGHFRIGEFAALIKMAPVIVTNNTGPVHLAAALGTPVVDVYARMNTQHTPWKVPSKVLYFDVPCKLCERGICPDGVHAAPKTVAPSQVYQAVMSYLK